MSGNTKPYAGWIVWGIAGLLSLMAFISKPSYTANTAAKQQLEVANFKIKKEVQLAEMQSPLTGNFDLTGKQKEATDRLTGAFTGILGGIHSKNEWDKNKANYQQVLGTKLTNELYLKAVDEPALNAVKQHKSENHWPISKNESTIVTFGDISNRHRVDVTVLTTYTKDKVRIPNMYRISYDLDSQKVLSYTSQYLSTFK